MISIASFNYIEVNAFNTYYTISAFNYPIYKINIVVPPLI